MNFIHKCFTPYLSQMDIRIETCNSMPIRPSPATWLRTFRAILRRNPGISRGSGAFPRVAEIRSFRPDWA